MIDDSQEIVAADASCTPVDSRTVNCGPADAYVHVTLVFGAGEDHFFPNNGTSIDMTVYGGPGDDDLETGYGDDELYGGEGDDEL